MTGHGYVVGDWVALERGVGDDARIVAIGRVVRIHENGNAMLDSGARHAIQSETAARFGILHCTPRYATLRDVRGELARREREATEAAERARIRAALRTDPRHAIMYDIANRYQDCYDDAQRLAVISRVPADALAAVAAAFKEKP